MSTKLKTLLLVIIVSLPGSFPVIAEEKLTMEQIVALCEKDANDQDDPDAYIEKCIDEKTSEAENSEKAE